MKFRGRNLGLESRELRFEHNRQGLRVVDLLERRYAAFPGLNLTWDTRESMRKHSYRVGEPMEAEFEPALGPLLEASLVDISDSVAYDAHDLDDGLKSGILREDQVAKLEIWRMAAERAPKEADPELRLRAAVRTILDLEVTDLVATGESRIAALGIRTVEDVRRAKEEPLAFSPALSAAKRELERFLRAEFYRHHRVVTMSEKSKRFVRQLFDAYVSNADQLPPQFRARAAEEGLHRAVADYIAGMTDRYAQDEVRRLYHPFENIL